MDLSALNVYCMKRVRGAHHVAGSFEEDVSNEEYHQRNAVLVAAEV